MRETIARLLTRWFLGIRGGPCVDCRARRAYAWRDRNRGIVCEPCYYAHCPEHGAPHDFAACGLCRERYEAGLV